MTFFLRAAAIFMCLIIPLANLISPVKSGNFTYPQTEERVKEERPVRAFSFGIDDICVSPDGDDSASGSFETPLKTFEAAKRLAAEKRKSTSDRITVWLRGGTYSLLETLDFTSDDASDVLYAAYPGEQVSIDGSVPVTGWEPDVCNGVACLSADFDTDVNFKFIIKNDESIGQNRYPESGYFYFPETNHEGAVFNEENTPWSYSYGDLEFTPDKAQTITAFKNPERVTARVLHYWCDDYSPVKGFDSERGRVLLSKPMSMKIEKGQKYYFENVREVFGKKGQWYYDNGEKKLYYVPLDGETAEDLHIFAAVRDKLITIDGCDGLSFEGLTFCSTNASFPVPADGEGWMSQQGITHPQAEYDCGGAVEVTNTENISFTDCRFENIGLCAVKFNRLVKNSYVRGCDFSNIGATGVYIHGYNEKDDARVTEGIDVIDCVIDGYGRYFYSAIGVFITHARNCRVENNEIHDGYYTAISVGWLWGYAFSVTRGNSIKNNLIYNIGQGWLSDMGGIYTLGSQPGTVLKGNVIHNVAADPGLGGYGGWGIYLDEGSQEISVTDNLVYDCGSQGFHQHYGENNMIINNIFALNKEGQAVSSFSNNSGQQGFSDPKTHNEFTLERNIFLSDGTPIFAKLNNRCFKDSKNICWDLKNGTRLYSVLESENKPLDRVYKHGMTMLGLFNEVIIADPAFKDARSFDFTLPSDNPVLESAGFVPWDYSSAGTLTAR